MIEGPFPPTLNTALDNKFMSGALGAVVQEQFGKHTKIVDMDIEHIQRRVIRYTTQLFNSEKEQTANWNILGKVYAQPDSMSYSFEMMQQLWKNGFSPDVKDHSERRSWIEHREIHAEIPEDSDTELVVKR